MCFVPGYFRWTALALLALARPVAAQPVEVHEFTLDNGMTFLLLPRDDQPNFIAAGWLAKVGSVNDRPGLTGLSHLTQHVMLRGVVPSDSLTSMHPSFQASLAFDRDGEGVPHVERSIDTTYSRASGTGIEAINLPELTFFFATLPGSALELWARVESDRLLSPDLSTFDDERGTLRSERMRRVETEPRAVFEEQFHTSFWHSTPYAWPVSGRSEDLDALTREDVSNTIAAYYQPANLVGVVVGDFELGAAKAMIQRSFGRLPVGGVPISEVAAIPRIQPSQKRLTTECECPHAIEVRYHTVPRRHPDRAALVMLARLLNGRSGRLHQALIASTGLAASASASAGGWSDPGRHAGSFVVTAEAMRSATPEDLETAWYAELERLRGEPVPEPELKKVKNQLTTDAQRRREHNLRLLLQLGYEEALGGWKSINDQIDQELQVTADDIQRVARRYFGPDARSVAIFRRRGSTIEGQDDIDPELLALKPADRAQALALQQQIMNYTVHGLRSMRAAIEAGHATVPPERAEDFALLAKYLIKKIDERIAQLEPVGDPP